MKKIPFNFKKFKKIKRNIWWGRSLCLEVPVEKLETGTPPFSLLISEGKSLTTPFDVVSEIHLLKNETCFINGEGKTIFSWKRGLKQEAKLTPAVGGVNFTDEEKDFFVRCFSRNSADMVSHFLNRA